MARIAIVSEDQDYIAGVRGLADRIEAQILDIGSASGVDQLSVMGVMTQRPDAVLFGSDVSTDKRVELTAELDSLHATVVVVWVLKDSAEAWRVASQSGARDLISPTAGDDQIVEQLRRAIGIVDRRRGQGVDDSEITRPHRGRIVTVMSPKGGSGKTMLSTNIAVGLQAESSRGVVLVDLDLQFGDVANALGIRPEYSVMDVLTARGDATATKAFLTAHPSGLFALPAPSNPAEAEDAEPSQIAKMLDQLAGEFDYVIVDTGAGIDEVTLTAVEQASDVMFITTIDVAAIQALRKAVVVLDRLKLDQHNRWFVLNRANSRTGLSASEIQEVTGLAIDCQVPSHRTISKSMNQGTPAIIDQRRTRVGKSLAEATELLSATSKKRGRS